MKVFAIGDLHLSGNPPTKPMDIFGPHWDNHWSRIKEDWIDRVTDEDIVFLVGDMSWALRLDEAACDLQEIASMPGKKYMIRGNHDYWWASANKMRNLMGDAITFLQGHGTAELIQTEEGPRIIAFGGTRAYLCPGDSHFTPETDQSIYDRELMRTESALQEMDAAVKTLIEEITVETKEDTTGSKRTEPSIIDIHNTPVTKLLLLHYPPFNESNAPSGFTALMETYNVDTCIFGHLHDQISFKRIPKEFGSTKLELVSADYLDFRLKEIMQGETMSRIHKEHLQAGYIFGDTINQEYIYLPSGEVGTDHPLAVLETPTKREDITLDEAVHMIDTLTLKRCSHPTLGKKSF